MTIIESEDKLVEYCIHTATLLYAKLELQNKPNNTLEYIAQLSSAPDGLGEDRLQLFEAVAAPSEPTLGKVHDPNTAFSDKSLMRKPLNISVSPDLFRQLQTNLNIPDSQIRRISTIPINRSFVYIDVSDFSKHDPKHQALIINSIVRLMLTGKLAAIEPKIEARLCIGDGFIFVLKEPEHAVMLASELACKIQTGVASQTLPIEFHFRMSVHCGDVYCFHDEGRKGWNYIGEGINGGQRVLAAIGKNLDDVIFISDQLAQRLRDQQSKNKSETQILEYMDNRGRKSDKHGKQWRVYQLNHERYSREQEFPTVRVG